MIKYSDMINIKSTITGEIKTIPATDVKKLLIPDGEKTGEKIEWKVIDEESGSIRTIGSKRQEEI
jgi:hypothetical protein